MKPLITKHRPQTLDDVVGHGTCVSRLKQEVKNYHNGKYGMDHILMTGPPGIGKTSIAYALCQDLYGEGWKNHVKTMNASDERGIGVVREDVKNFASSIPSVKGFNILILDEFDNMTQDAQGALRMTMETYAPNCRFILCANYSNRIIEPIKDRCAYYRFKPLDSGTIQTVVKKVCDEEGYNFSNPAWYSHIAEASRGSLRRALTLISQLPNDGIEPPIELLDELAPQLDRKAVREAIRLAFAGKADEAEHAIMECVWDSVNSTEVLEEMTLIIKDSTLNVKTKVEVIKHIADCEYRILFGCSPNIQLRGLVASLALLK